MGAVLSVVRLRCAAYPRFIPGACAPPMSLQNLLSISVLRLYDMPRAHSFAYDAASGCAECSPFTNYQASAFVGTVRTASGCQAENQSRSLRVQQNLVTWHAPGRMGSWHMQPRLQPNAQLIRECAVTALRGPPRRLQCYRAALQKKMLGLPAHVRPRWEQALAARRRWRYAFQLAFPSAWEWRLAMTPSGIRLSRSRGDRPSRRRFPPHTQSGGGAREAGPGCQPGQVA